jgi:phospholipase/carboxylesterase
MPADRSRVHQGQPVFATGASLGEAAVAMLMLHGRGATAQGILGLADELAHSAVAYRAPQANRRSWYPYSFLDSRDRNEPDLTSALAVIGDALEGFAEAGFGPEKVVLLGFSQGACLALEYAARHPQRYGGVVGLSGGLIGPEDEPLDYDGDLAGTPVFLGCSDQDPHIPLERVRDTEHVMRELGARVTARIYEGMGHTINEDEIKHVRLLLDALAGTGSRVTPPDADADADDLDDDFLDDTLDDFEMDE